MQSPLKEGTRRERNLAPKLLGLDTRAGLEADTCSERRHCLGFLPARRLEAAQVSAAPTSESLASTW
jgi:hypothetical protein